MSVLLDTQQLVALKYKTWSERDGKGSHGVSSFSGVLAIVKPAVLPNNIEW